MKAITHPAWRRSNGLTRPLIVDDDRPNSGAPAKRSLNGRGDRIRTCDLVDPNHALYQSELHPENRLDDQLLRATANLASSLKPSLKSDSGRGASAASA